MGSAFLVPLASWRGVRGEAVLGGFIGGFMGERRSEGVREVKEVKDDSLAADFKTSENKSEDKCNVFNF